MCILLHRSKFRNVVKILSKFCWFSWSTGQMLLFVRQNRHFWTDFDEMLPEFHEISRNILDTSNIHMFSNIGCLKTSKKIQTSVKHQTSTFGPDRHPSRPGFILLAAAGRKARRYASTSITWASRPASSQPTACSRLSAPKMLTNNDSSLNRST